jgi:hypothetical protein
MVYPEAALQGRIGSMEEKRPSLSLELPDDDDLAQAWPVLPTTGSRWAKIELGDFFWIGRTPIANLVVNGDQEISRFHAIVERDGDRYQIMDMRSMNGTTVNGRRVRKQLLVPGDVIRVGQSRIRFSPSQDDDTIFEAGSVRRSGTTSFELRRHWSSLQMERPAPSSAEGGPYQYRIPQAITGDLAAFEVFLTVAIDRIAAAFRAYRAFLYLPPIGQNRPLPLGRQCQEEGIDLVEVPEELLLRVNRAFGPAPDDPLDDASPRESTMLLWNGDQLVDDRMLRRGVLTDVSAMTASLPEVRRAAAEARADPGAGWVAWIHLEFDPEARSLARDPATERVFLDVIGGLSAAASRYVAGYEAL